MPVTPVRGMTPQRADQIEMCLDLRATGMTEKDISLALGARGVELSKATVHRRLQEGYSLVVLPSVEAARAKSVDQHERMLAGIAFRVHAGDLKACAVWLKAQDQLARLQGLYAPVEIKVEHAATTSVDEELAALAEKLGLNDRAAEPAP